MAEPFSIVKGQKEFVNIPSEESLLIAVMNDDKSITTKVAGLIPGSNIGVSEGKAVTRNIILWAKLPEYRNLL